MKKPIKLPSLEESLTEMTQLVEKMEQGNLTLEQSLTHFERGIQLVKHCQQILTSAEQKVEILIKQNNKNTLTNYPKEEEAGKDEH